MPTPPLPTNGSGEQQSCCRVVFKTSRIKTNDIPGIEEYRDALQHAFSTHSGKPSVIEYLKRLEKFSSHAYSDVLYVTDNGAGFDDQGMEAVLSEGSPHKREGSSGSFGVGHLTTYALSGLQYVFYGSKHKDNVMRAAGHAILSAQNRKDEKHCRSCHGYYLTDHNMNMFNQRQYCKGREEVPVFLQRELATLENFGSTVCILGFNASKLSGDSETQIGTSIRKAVAENFAVAINENTLEVVVEEHGVRTQISARNIKDYLEKTAKSGRSTKDRKGAMDTQMRISTLVNPSEKGFLPDSFQDCAMYLRNNTDESQVSIWRNGMLITGNPGLAKKFFATKRPFNALVHLSGQRNPCTAHDLVRKAETTMHNKISSAELNDKKDRKALRNFYVAVREWICKHAEEISSEQHELVDELMTPVGDPARYIGKLPEVEFPSDEPDSGPVLIPSPNGEKPDKPDKPRKPRPPRPARRRSQADVVVVSKWRNGKYHVQIVSSVNVDRGTLVIVALTGSDPSSLGMLLPQPVSIVNALLSDGTELRVEDSNAVVLKGVLAGKPVDLLLTLLSDGADLQMLAMECVVSIDKGAGPRLT